MSLECGAAGAAMDEYVDDSTTCKPVDSINLGVGTPAHSDSAVRPTTQTLARADRLALALFRRQLATGLLLQRHVVPGEVRTQACVLYCTPDFTYLWWFESVLVGKKKGIALADIVEACRAAKPLAPAEPPARGEFSGRVSPPGHEPPLAARLEAASTLQRFFLRLRLARCSPEEAERTGLQRGDAAPDADPAARRTL